MRRRVWASVGFVALVVALIALYSVRHQPTAAQSQKAGAPAYVVDPFWPKMEGKFDPQWIFGSIGGITTDPTNDHVFVLNRSRTIAADEDYAVRGIADCCKPAPPVLEFDAAGNFIQGWGGPGPGYEWPETEHGITIDYKGNVWIGASGKNDAHFLKFTKNGKFLLQIGHQGKRRAKDPSNDPDNLGSAAKAYVYPKTNEVFIADGYGNRRVIVFDADTGKYKRHWSAYGHKPDDTVSHDRYIGNGTTPPPPQQFTLPHAVLVSDDGLVYVADRSNSRIQVFKVDGTYVKEAFLRPETGTGAGTYCDMAWGPGQKYIYDTDPGNHHVWVIDRETLKPVTNFVRLGHQTGQAYHLHTLAVDSKGNVYTGENTGKRVTKWLFKGNTAKISE